MTNNVDKKTNWITISTFLGVIVAILAIFGFILNSKIDFVKGPLEIKIASLEKENNDLKKDLLECRSNLNLLSTKTNNGNDSLPIQNQIDNSSKDSFGPKENTLVSHPNDDFEKFIDKNIGIYFDMFEIEINKIEKKGKELILTVIGKNVSEKEKKFYLRKGYAKKTKLINETTGKEYSIKKIEKISEKSTDVSPGEKLFFNFIFDNPIDEKSLNFVTALQCDVAVRGKVIYINEPIALAN